MLRVKKEKYEIKKYWSSTLENIVYNLVMGKAFLSKS